MVRRWYRRCRCGGQSCINLTAYPPQVGTTQAEVNTPSDTSSRSNIALLYGNLLGKELLQVGPSVHKSLGIERAEGWATNANWSQKRSTFLLFINRKSGHRFGVELSRIAELLRVAL